MTARRNTTKLPTRIYVRDYHEFDYLQSILRGIIPGLRIREVGMSFEGYVGIVYTGNLRSNKNKKLMNSLRKECKDFEQTTWG